MSIIASNLIILRRIQVYSRICIKTYSTYTPIALIYSCLCGYLHFDTGIHIAIEVVINVISKDYWSATL